MSESCLTKLYEDLKSPPADFPRFDFDYHFFVDHDGEVFADVTGFVAYRVLGSVAAVCEFLVDGGDIYALFKQQTGLETAIANRLVFPGEIVNSSHNISRITNEEMSVVVKNLIDTGRIEYEQILASLREEPTVQEDFTEDNIRARVIRNMQRFGDRSKDW